MSDWEALSARISDAKRWDKAAAKQLLFDNLDDGGLSRNVAAMLSERTGWSTRQLYRWRNEADASSDGGGEDAGTFIDRIEASGPLGFVFDDLALAMVYALGGNVARFREQVIDAGWAMPSLPTMSRRWHRVPLHVRDGARHGQRNRHSNLFYVRHQAGAVDELWQLDDFDLDLYVNVDTDDDSTGVEVEVTASEGSKSKVRRPHLLVLIDDRSRFVPAWALLASKPTSADVASLFADAFEVRPDDSGAGVLIGGPPERIGTDNAREFHTTLVQTLIATFASQLAPAPAFCPAAKGKVERAGQTLQARIVTGLAGVVSDAVSRNPSRSQLAVANRHVLSFDQLEGIVADVVHDYNYRAAHSALGKATTPFDVYSTRAGPRGTFEDSELGAYYQPVPRAGGERTVSPTGVNVFGESWVSRELDENRIGSTVVVKGLANRRDRLAVFDSNGRFLCFVSKASELPDEERDRFVDDRIAATKEVARHARSARGVLVGRTARLASGASGVEADRAVLQHDSPTTDSTGSDGDVGGGDQVGGGKARPRRRPPSKAGRGDDDVPPRSATPGVNPGLEAALDAEAARRRGNQ